MKLKYIYRELVFFIVLILGVLALYGYKSGFYEKFRKNIATKNSSPATKNISKTVGFTLIPLVGAQKISLINMSGSEVHSWKIDAARARLKPNGNILVVHGSKWGIKNEPWKSLRPTIKEYDWSGKVVFEYTANDIIHHDIQILENGNLIFPKREIVPSKDKLKINDLNRRKLNIRSDSVIELNPKSKEIVWEWKAHKHIDLNFCGRRPCTTFTGDALANKKMSDWSHINTTQIVPENKHYDNGDVRFKPGNIIVLPRNFWMVFVVDKESKKTVWEYEGDYKGGLSGGHEAQMIPKGMPGAGNILIFDNGRIKHKGESFVLEVNPITKEVVWIYENGKKFFSNSAGSMQRLKNGNTLISEDLNGFVFEVTPKKNIVWKYKTKYRIARAKRYTKDFSAKFNNLDLY